MNFIAQYGLSLTYLVIPPLMAVALVVDAMCILCTTDFDELDL